MMLVVDSGSTKADWALVTGNGKTSYLSTMGFNPYFHSPEKVFEELTKQSFTDVVPLAEVKQIHYYGAGCPDDFYRGKMAKALQAVFKNAHIEVAHDLLGAARATCGHEAGLAGILGTGSNSCAYDGKQITDNVPALAHVIGDEGGGVYLGKLTLQAHFYRELPADLEMDFIRSYPEGDDAIIHRIYGEGQNVHIAGFAEFLVRHREHPYAKQLIHQSFREFAVRHLKKYRGWESARVNLVGSIASLLEKELKDAFQQEGLTVGKIVRKPIEQLVEYHLADR